MGNINQLFPNIWISEVDLGDFKVRGGLIAGTERTLVWDTLSHPRDMEPILPLTREKEVFVVYSHADWDHIWGTAGLQCAQQVIIAHQDCLRRFREDVPLTLKTKKAAEPKTWDEVKLIPPNLTFLNDMQIDLGGQSLQISSLPGHTLDSIVGFFLENGVLMAGDSVETPFPVVNSDSPVQQWIEQLSRWEQDKRVKTVVPAHGSIGGREIIRANIKYLQSLLDGTRIKLPSTLPPFYQTVHQDNLKYTRENFI